MKFLKSANALLIVAFLAITISLLFGINAIAMMGVMVAGSFFLQNRKTGMAFMAITVEIWENDIIDNLFKDNQFASRAFNEDGYVIGGKIVHIPVAGKPAKSKKNLTDFPRSASKRVDDDILYSLDTIYRDPKHVEKIEQYELSYDKRQSIMGEEQAQLIQDAMDSLLFRWSKKGKNMDQTGNFILTTGGASTEDVLAGATGGRKTFTKDVFSKVKKRMDNDNIPAKGRIALLTANHHQQLIDSFSATELTNFYRYADMENGVIGRYLGFDVMMRSSVQRWRKTAGVWAPVDELDEDFEAGVNDSAASILYYEKAVGRARGDVNVFDNQGRAEYYGDIMSMNMRLGGRVRRTEGIYSIIEDIAA